MEFHFLAVDLDRSGNTRSVTPAEDRHGKLCPSCSHQAGETDNFAFPDIEGDVINNLLFRIDRMVYVPVFDIQRDISDFYTVALREPVFQFASDHAADNTVLAEIINALCERFYCFSVTDNGNVVRNVRDLIDFVRNNDRGHPLFLELKQQVQQRLGIFFIQ